MQSYPKSLSHPGLGWLHVFSSFPPRPCPPPQKLFTLTSTPIELNLWYLAQSIYGSGEMYWMTFPWPWPKVTAVALISKNLLVCTIKWEPLIRSLQKWQLCCSSHGYYLIRFWNCWKLLFWQIFLKNFGCVFSRSNIVLAIISQEWLVRLMWNEKEVHWLDTGYNIWPWPLTSPMTLTLEFQGQSLKSFISGMGRPIDDERKGCESSIHDHDIDLCDHGEVGGCTG